MNNKQAVTLTRAVVLETTECCACGVPFAVPGYIMAERRKTAGSIWCPNGHKQGWQETDADRLRKELARAVSDRKWWETNAEHERDQRRATERSLSATKGQMTRLRKRVEAGVCPHCNRTFSQLARHMASKHADVCGA